MLFLAGLHWNIHQVWPLLYMWKMWKSCALKKATYVSGKFLIFLLLILFQLEVIAKWKIYAKNITLICIKNRNNVGAKGVCFSGLRAGVTTLGTKALLYRRQHYVNSSNMRKPWLVSYPIYMLVEVAATGPPNRLVDVRARFPGHHAIKKKGECQWRYSQA